MLVPTQHLAYQQRDEFLQSHDEHFRDQAAHSHEGNEPQKPSIAVWVGDDHAWQRSRYGMPDVLICTHGVLANMLETAQMNISDIGRLVSHLGSKFMYTFHCYEG